MAWQSSLWVRWLGWTALYALILYGGAGVVNALGFDRRLSLSGTSGTIVSLLILAVLTFAIGVHFRSRWWGSARWRRSLFRSWQGSSQPWFAALMR
jgi:hypothetical protein